LNTLPNPLSVLFLQLKCRYLSIYTKRRGGAPGDKYNHPNKPCMYKEGLTKGTMEGGSHSKYSQLVLTLITISIAQLFTLNRMPEVPSFAKNGRLC
jgi:hypothetical protein